MRIARLSSAAAIVAVYVSSSSGEVAAATIHRGVHRQLQQVGKADIVAVLKSSVQVPSESALIGSRGAKIAALVERLEAQAATAQSGIDELLVKEAANTKSPLFEQQHSSWIMNARYFQGATFELVEALSALADIAEIREQETYDIDQAEPRSLQASGDLSTNQWGVDRINAPLVWADGVNGTGVVVGSIDSGVRFTHQLLKRNYRQSYGWFSPGDRSSSPSDQVGHGTHTMGTMVGADGVGVAPGAQWIACKACPTSCTEAAIVQCTEWMLCPTDTNGNNKDCSKAPHVINNSWSTRSGNTVNEPIINAWIAAGIVPVFSNGNKGPTCGTVQSPGDLEGVISVGNIATNGSLSRSSSRGPSLSGVTKPDISAPGHLIASASYLNDQDLRVVSGTSMAAPHVAGAVALLLSAKPGLSVAEVRESLTSSADKASVGEVLDDCDGTGSGPLPWPNNNYGHGILDVHAAYRKLVPKTALPTPVPITTAPPTSPPAPTPAPTPLATTQAPTPVPSTQAPSSCSLEYQVDLVGNDIGNALGANPTTCCSLCFEFAKCRAFTWSNYNGGTCWFKDRATGPRKTAVDVVSAAIDRDSSARCRVSIDTDFAGNDLTSVASGNPATCCSLCAERRVQGCKAYTWSNYQGGTCWLKTNQGVSTKSQGLQSGQYVV